MTKKTKSKSAMKKEDWRLFDGVYAMNLQRGDKIIVNQKNNGNYDRLLMLVDSVFVATDGSVSIHASTKKTNYHLTRNEFDIMRLENYEED